MPLWAFDVVPGVPEVPEAVHVLGVVGLDGVERGRRERVGDDEALEARAGSLVEPACTRLVSAVRGSQGRVPTPEGVRLGELRRRAIDEEREELPEMVFALLEFPDKVEANRARVVWLLSS